VSQDSIIAAGSVTVTCAPGEVVTGGGVNAPNAELKASMPTAAGDGWTISVTGNSGTITVTAICVAGTMS